MVTSVHHPFHPIFVSSLWLSFYQLTLPASPDENSFEHFIWSISSIFWMMWLYLCLCHFEPSFVELASHSSSESFFCNSPSMSKDASSSFFLCNMSMKSHCLLLFFLTEMTMLIDTSGFDHTGEPFLLLFKWVLKCRVGCIIWYWQPLNFHTDKVFHCFWDPPSFSSHVLSHRLKAHCWLFDDLVITRMVEWEHQMRNAS